jgi:serine/threonine protein kinase
VEKGIKMSDAPLASRLVGKTVGRWTVTEKRKKAEGDNSGFWSTCYTVTDDTGQVAFLKAYNYSYAFGTGASADILKVMTENFTYERDLLQFCCEQKMRRVVTAIDSGEYREENEILPVPYLVFEIAQGSLKTHRAMSNPDLAWKLKAFHGALVGLSQLHSRKIAHQDIKPSNILIFGEAFSKLSDLGSATQLNNESRHWTGPQHCGDLRYAPVELLYKYFSPDWNTRRFAADLFMMGGILTFMVTGSNFLSLLHARLPESQKHDKFGGTFEQATPFLLKAYAETLDEIRPVILASIRDELIQIIAELCHPIPEKRGSPQCLGSVRPRYSLERYISVVDRLSKKVAWGQNA